MNDFHNILLPIPGFSDQFGSQPQLLETRLHEPLRQKAQEVIRYVMLRRLDPYRFQMGYCSSSCFDQRNLCYQGFYRERQMFLP